MFKNSLKLAMIGCGGRGTFGSLTRTPRRTYPAYQRESSDGYKIMRILPKKATNSQSAHRSTLEIRWTPKAELPVPLQSLTTKATVINNRIYVVGGRSDQYPDSSFTFEYDPQRDSWTRKTDVPVKHHLLVTVAHGGKIYVLSEDLQHNYVYDPSTDRWRPFAPCPNSRIPVTAAVVDGKIHLMSGIHDIVFNLSAKIDVYDPAIDTWHEKKPMPDPRIASPVVVDGKIYLFGGIQPVKNEHRALYVDAVDVYDPKTETWEKRTPGSTGPAVLSKGYVFVVGGCVGEIPNKERAIKEVYAYNLRTDKWQPSTDLPRPTLGAAVVVLNDRLHVIGGSNGPPEWKDYGFHLQGVIVVTP